jgi:hypothetical protein
MTSSCHMRKDGTKTAELPDFAAVRTAIGRCARKGHGKIIRVRPPPDAPHPRTCELSNAQAQCGRPRLDGRSCKRLRASLGITSAAITPRG